MTWGNLPLDLLMSNILSYSTLEFNFKEQNV